LAGIGAPFAYDWVLAGGKSGADHAPSQNRGNQSERAKQQHARHEGDSNGAEKDQPGK
jgi:hypothetical protein